MPTIWLLTHRRAGDLAQMRRFAALIGWPTETKRLAFRSNALAAIPALARALLDRSRSDPLEPPWPDLVVCAEGRASAVAVAIKQASGGRTRIVVIGRPAGGPEPFDLVVTTAQFRMPKAANVVELSLPLAMPPPADPAAVAELERKLAGAPRPWVALLIGGTSFPDVLDREAARRLAHDVMAEVKRSGGSLLAITSPRTGQAVEDELSKALGGAASLHLWSRDRADNPFAAYLAVADRFIVTSDSVSMAVEAIGIGKPVAIYPLPQYLPPKHRVIAWLDARAGLDSPTPGGLRRLARALFELGVIEVRTDRSRFFERLVKEGRVTVFPDALPTPVAADRPQPAEDLVAGRILELFGPDHGPVVRLGNP